MSFFSFYFNRCKGRLSCLCSTGFSKNGTLVRESHFLKDQSKGCLKSGEIFSAIDFFIKNTIDSIFGILI